MTTAGTPMVRIDVDTDQSTAEMWEEARKIDPKPMAWAAFVRAVPLDDGRVRVTFALDPEEYAACIIDGPEDAPLLIETVLHAQELDILRPLEPDCDPSDWYPGDDEVPF